MDEENELSEVQEEQTEQEEKEEVENTESDENALVSVKEDTVNESKMFYVYDADKVMLKLQEKELNKISTKIDKIAEERFRVNARMLFIQSKVKVSKDLLLKPGEFDKCVKAIMYKVFGM